MGDQPPTQWAVRRSLRVVVVVVVAAYNQSFAVSAAVLV